MSALPCFADLSPLSRQFRVVPEAVVRTVGPIGQVQVTATADADLGAGVRNIVTPLDIVVVAGEAMSGAITPVGPAEPIP